MGSPVGSTVGVSVGSLVGWSVGVAVGSLVGRIVGMAVGGSTGVRVGQKVGRGLVGGLVGSGVLFLCTGDGTLKRTVGGSVCSSVVACEIGIISRVLPSSSGTADGAHEKSMVGGRVSVSRP